MDDVVSESNEENNCKENRFEHLVPVPVLTPPGLVALTGLLMIVAVRRVDDAVYHFLSFTREPAAQRVVDMISSKASIT